MTTRVPIRYGGTGANSASAARTALGVPPLAAYDTANSAYDQANAAYAQANAAYDAANNAQVTVYANNASNVTTQNVNFVNTATVTVTVTADGSNANIEFTAAPQTVVNDTYTAAGNTAAAATANIANGLYAISTNAYDQANSARDQANTAYGQANDAYAQANTAYGQANDAYAAANTANTNALNAYAQANTAYDQANSAYAQANAAYGQANDAYAAANTANTNALAAYGQANLAYTQANAAYNQANAAYAEANLKLNLTGGTIGGDLAVSGNLTVSGNTYYVNVSTYQVDDPLIYLAANNDTSDVVDIGFMGGHNTSGVYQHSGLIRHAADGNWYLFTGLAEEGHENNVVDIANTTLATLKANINANSLLLVGNAVATQANLTISHNQANTAYGQANNAYAQANDAYSAANNAANTVRVSQNGASTLSAKQLNFVNTGNIVIAVTDAGDGNANIEFELTTGGGTLSNIAISSNGTFAVNANAFNFINSSSVQVTVDPGIDGNANITFTASGSGGAVVVRDNFTGDGNTSNFTLSTEPTDQNHVLVFVDLVFQSENAFSVSGDTLAFASAPDNGSEIDVYIYGGGVGSTVVTSDVFTGTGACTSYILSQTGTASRTFVYLDGVAQRPTIDYQVSGTALSFNVAPANASVIEVRTLSAFNTVDINVAPVTINSDLFTGTGACTEFTLSQTGTTDSTFVFLNGVAQKPGTNYTVGGVGNNILTMASAPANGSILEVRSMGPFKVIENQSRIDSDIFSGDGNTTVFTLSTSTITKKVFAFIDGVSQKPFVDYSVGGNKITFTEAPPSGTFIEVRSVSPFLFATSTGELAYNQANAAYDLASNAVLKTGDTMTGNLTFSGTGLRILGDMSNATVGNRLAFQTSVANGSTTVLIIPNGTGTNGQLLLRGGSEVANDSFGQIVLINSTEFRIASGNNGTGVVAPMTFWTSGSERMRIDANGNIGLGTTAPNTTLHVNGTTTLQEVKEKVNVSATALDANLTIDVLNGAVTFLTSNASANSTINFRGNSTVTLDTFMVTGQSMTAAVMVTNGATAYRIANVQIDGTSITPKWSGGSAPTASANSIDVYAFTMIKTAANTFTVLGSKTQFA